MWPVESINWLYEAGVNNDRLCLLYNLNKKNKISIKTSFRKTKRINMDDIEIQGFVWGPLKCSVQVDSIGKQCLDDGKYLFNYRGLVNIPPLSFIDDIISVNKCGVESIKANSFINTQIESMKQEFGIVSNDPNKSKCKQIHVGEFKKKLS